MQTVAENGIENASSQDELFLILDVLPVPIASATLHDRKIAFYNKAFRQRFGNADKHVATVDDFITTHITEVQQNTIKGLWSSLWQDDISTLKAAEVIPPLALDILTADGALFNVMLGGLILADKGIGIAYFDSVAPSDPVQKNVLRHAYEDFLTGLANRRKLMERWNQLMAKGPAAQAAFLILDLDRFKQVNDQLGHNAGDDVLRGMAKRLLSCVRSSDLVCRFGGDEFGILLSRPTDEESVGQICERILKAVKEPMEVAGYEVRIGTSIGVSRVPDHGRTFDEIFKAADEALYQCKIGGRGCWRWAQVPSE